VHVNKVDALNKFGLDQAKKTIFILGGSLGAASINKAVENYIKYNYSGNVNIIWQTGKNYFGLYRYLASKNIVIKDFIDDMNVAYSACDLLISRACATTIAEIITLGIPAILVPSPNVAENHQFFNAKSLSEKSAAVLLEDNKLEEGFTKKVLEILNNNSYLDEMSKNIRLLNKVNAAEVIANKAIAYCKK
jgi:UDP-N-acetylglucosamine--N-acetylmuramyl-(pentapeptide) pyrophosphoryl-undecaprenol N-acetylglucosamine transferase